MSKTLSFDAYKQYRASQKIVLDLGQILGRLENIDIQKFKDYIPVRKILIVIMDEYALMRSHYERHVQIMRDYENKYNASK